MATTTITKLPGSQVEIKSELEPAVFEKERKASVEAIGMSVSVDGFRPGKIPESVLVQKYGEMVILHEMAERAIAKAFPEILATESLEALGKPEVSITKLAPGNPLEFTIKTYVMPDVTLPDYKALAKAALNEDIGNTEVADKEIEDVVAEIKKMRTNPETSEAPELDDAFVQSIGNFKDVADFREKIKSNIALEKEVKLRDKRRALLLERIESASTTELPEILVVTELARMIAELKADIAHMGGSYEKYLEERGKTAEDVEREMKPAAQKRVLYELVLKKIGKLEKLEVSEADIEKESEQILSQYKGADPERVGLYVEGLLMNEKVLQFLENQK